MRILYSLFFYLLTPLLFLRLALKVKKAKDYQVYSQQGRWRERLGWLPTSHFKVAPIWFHTVSVGEFIAALPLIRQVIENHPNIPIVITTTTLTGSEQVLKIFAEQVYHVYLPWDLPHAMQHFYRHLKPRVGLIMETEIWPNLIHHAKQQNIPLVLLNARMSERSARGYSRIGNLTKTMLEDFTAICVQSVEDGKRFLQLGARQDALHISGSIKFDLNVDETLKDKSKSLRHFLNWQDKLVLIAASTHNTEDEIILRVYERLKNTFPQLVLLIVPRHPERFKQIHTLCQEFGFSVQKRSVIDSELLAAGIKIDATTQILLGDSMGEMMLYYNLSDIVVMGGTFMPNGGHNILEPAALGLPLFYGSSMFNFKTINETFLQQQAAVQVANEENLYKTLHEYLQEPQRLEKLGKNALKLMEENAGARDKMYQVVVELGLVSK